MFYLEQVGAFVPETSVPVRELAEPLGLTSSQLLLFTRFLGLDRVATAPDTELPQMLAAAGEDALQGVDRATVRFLVHAHTMQHIAPPARHQLEDVRAALGLKNASVFGMSHLNCAAGLHALQAARFLLEGSGPEDKVLVVTGDKILSHQIHLIPETTIMGEAASACLIGRDPRGDRVLGRAIRVLGRFYECLDCSDDLQLEYKQLYATELSDVMCEALKDSGTTPEEISLILPHNVNRLSWKRIASDLGIPAGRVYLDNVPKLGHCFSSDPFINLASARAAGRVQPGDRVLLTTAGLGAAFAAVVVEIGEGRDR